MITSAQSGRWLEPSPIREQAEGRPRAHILNPPDFAPSVRPSFPLPSDLLHSPLPLQTPIRSAVSTLQTRNKTIFPSNLLLPWSIVSPFPLAAKSGLYFLNISHCWLSSHPFIPMTFQKLSSWKHYEPPDHQGVWLFLSLRSSWRVWICDTVEILTISYSLEIVLFLTFVPWFAHRIWQWCQFCRMFWRWNEGSNWRPDWAVIVNICSNFHLICS